MNNLVQSFQNLAINPQKRLFKGNFFAFKYQYDIKVYKIQILPEIKMGDVKFIYQLMGSCRDQLMKVFETYQITNYLLYTPNLLEKDFQQEVPYEDQMYQISISSGYFTKLDTASIQTANFLGGFFKRVLRLLRYKQIGKKLFNPDIGKNFDSYQVQCWPGFSTSVKQFGNSSKCQEVKTLINIDTSFKVIRMDSVLQQMKKLNNPQRIINFLVGQIVMTCYNRRFYRISDVKFDLNPNSVFHTSNDSSSTYVEYYSKKWSRKITDLEQPLLEYTDRKTGDKVYLIPELCNMTGLDESLRNNRSLMSTLANVTKPQANQRLMLTYDLIKALEVNEKCSMYMKKWGLFIDQNPINLNGARIDPGQLILGNGQMISLNLDSMDAKRNFEKQIQTVMYEQPNVENWVIMFDKNCEKQMNLFANELRMATIQFKFKIKPPKIIQIQQTYLNAWIEEISKLPSQLSYALFILQGQKKQGHYYQEIKRYCLENGIKSQMILSSTIEAQKGLRSIANKVLVQVVAKIGGIPWIISQLPFSFQENYTMIVGIDVYHKLVNKQSKSIFAFVSTNDKNLSRYNSQVITQNPGEEIGSMVQTCTRQALECFQRQTGHYPSLIIVYRDGVSEGQRNALKCIEVYYKLNSNVFLLQIESMRAALTNLELTDTKLIFICINKITSTKFYALPEGDSITQNGGFKSVENPLPGSVFDDPLICNENEFYIISQKSTQGNFILGIASPSHYYILANDLLQENMTEQIKIQMVKALEILSYKLCYLYYNCSGSIKIPAPIQLAHRLSNFIGDKFIDVKVHDNFCDQNSMYFL